MHRRHSFVLALVATLIAAAASAKDITNDELSRNPEIQTGQIVTIIEDVFAGEPRDAIDTTIRIFMCESGLRQGSRAIGIIRHLDAQGNPLRGGDGYDIGAAQIRKKSHSAPWTKQLNPHAVYDNVVYALKLQHGRLAAGEGRFDDWYPSRTCWRQPPLTMVYAS